MQLQRNVPYGKSMLVNAVMEKYGLKYEAATTKLQNETLLHSRFDGDEVTESLRYMASNINRVIDYYVSRNRLSIQKAYLIGHSTSIKGFATLLSNELNMPIEKVERLKNIALDKKAYVEEATLTSYVTNLGAVIDPVDFIPKRLIESGARKENTKTLIVGFVGALVVSALLVLIPLVQVVALNAEIGSLNKSIKKLSIINDVVNEYYSAKDKYNDIAAFAALTSDSDDALQDFVDYLEKSMPSDITIQSFNVASGAITVNGTAGSKSSVAKFIQELQKNSSVLNVDAPTITETKDNAGTIEVTVSLSCTFVGGTSNTTDMKLKISERDKKLLVVVLAVLIMALAYFFGFQNLSDQVDTLSTKKTTLETTQRDLKEKNNNKQKYVNDTMNYLKQYDNLLDRYAAGSTQPNSIDFFNKTESVTGTWVRSLSLSPTTVLYKFGQIASSNVNGKSNYTSNLTGYKSTINIAYESDYSQWKNFIKYVNTYADKSTIDALSASYNEATGVVTGTASISLYSIEGGKRDYKEPSFDVKTGTGNIFSTVTPTE